MKNKNSLEFIIFSIFCSKRSSTGRRMISGGENCSNLSLKTAEEYNLNQNNIILTSCASIWRQIDVRLTLMMSIWCRFDINLRILRHYMASSRDHDIKRLMARIHKSEEFTKNNKSYLVVSFQWILCCLMQAWFSIDDTQAKLLRQIALAGLGDHVARWALCIKTTSFWHHVCRSDVNLT